MLVTPAPVASPPGSSRPISPEDVLPIPSCSGLGKRRKVKRGKCAIITESPYKNELSEEVQAREAKERKKVEKKRIKLEKDEEKKNKKKIVAKKSQGKKKPSPENESDESDAVDTCTQNPPRAGLCVPFVANGHIASVPGKRMMTPKRCMYAHCANRLTELRV